MSAKKKGFRYAYATGQLDNILDKVQNVGRPDKLDNNYLKSTWLLKNKQYGSILPILTDMGFLNGGVPTELYAEYQNKGKSKSVLAKGVANAYPELFKAYPKAHSMSTSQLKDYFREQTGLESRTISMMAATFTKLCSLADFNSDNGTGKSNGTGQAGGGPSSQINLNQNHSPIPITMNIQLVIPSDATCEQYDAIFSSIRKNFRDN